MYIGYRHSYLHIHTTVTILLHLLYKARTTPARPTTPATARRLTALPAAAPEELPLEEAEADAPVSAGKLAPEAEAVTVTLQYQTFLGSQVVVMTSVGVAVADEMQPR